ncbi:MAG: shikimate kinase [Verrucomicrobiales bacterium]
MPTASQPARNVILIGFMGSGKSTVGRLLGRSLGYEVVDTDHLVVEGEGRPIAEIFADLGESGFRDLETAALESLRGREGLVIATGGGIVLRPKNRNLLGSLGYTVWLNADEEAICKRVSRSRKRPLLEAGDPRATVARLLEARRPIYRECADLVVDTAGIGIKEVSSGIEKNAHNYFFERGE